MPSGFPTPHPNESSAVLEYVRPTSGRRVRRARALCPPMAEPEQSAGEKRKRKAVPRDYLVHTTCGAAASFGAVATGDDGAAGSKRWFVCTACYAADIELKRSASWFVVDGNLKPHEVAKLQAVGADHFRVANKRSHEARVHTVPASPLHSSILLTVARAPCVVQAWCTQRMERDVCLHQVRP
jgi:hypothetical protein